MATPPAPEWDPDIRENWKTGSRLVMSPCCFRVRIPSAGVQAGASLRRGTNRWCSTDPRPHSFSGYNAPLLRRPPYQCPPILPLFHYWWSPAKGRGGSLVPERVEYPLLNLVPLLDYDRVSGHGRGADLQARVARRCGRAGRGG